MTPQYLGIALCTPKIQVRRLCDFFLFSLHSLLKLEAKNGAALPDHIYMDAMGFGMGCCCLQLTFQACDVSDARRMYDGLIPVGPILVSFLRQPKRLLQADIKV